MRSHYRIIAILLIISGFFGLWGYLRKLMGIPEVITSDQLACMVGLIILAIVEVKE